MRERYAERETLKEREREITDRHMEQFFSE